MLIVLQKYREGRWINLLSLLMTPYVCIVFINNFFIYRMGFYRISDNVLIMFLMAFIAFFLGTLIFKVRANVHNEIDNELILKRYDINKIKMYLYLVGVLGLIETFIYYRQGLVFSVDVDSEGVMGNGPIGHLLLSSFSVLPIYFLYWTYNKKVTDLIPVILIIIVAFSSLIKYNVIGPVITLFIFVSIYRQSLLKKGAFILCLCVFLLFVGNYAFGFLIAGSDVDPTFYLGHFWAYFAGSAIYDNYLFTTGVNFDHDIFYKLLMFLFALPNMFFQKFFDERYFQQEILPMNDISNFGEQSNILDVIGYLYPYRGDVFDIILLLIVVFLTGVLFSFIYYYTYRQSSFNTFLANFLTYFVFLCFYSPFFVLPAPWEIIIWALILPSLFLKRKRIHNKYKYKSYEKNRV